MSFDRRAWITTAAAALSACARRQEPSAPLRTVRIGIAQTLAASASVSLAEELGYLREAGMTLEATSIQSGPALIPSLVSGKMDLYVGSLSPALLTPSAQSAGIRVVFAREAIKPGCSTWGSIYGLKKSFPGGLADLRELKGKKIAYSNRGSLTEFGLETLAKTGGLSPTDIEGVILRSSEALGALAAGKIDGVFTMSYSPNAQGELGKRAALFPAMARCEPGFQFSFILCGNALRGPERAVGRAFLRAFMKSSREFAAGKTPRNYDELAEKSGLDPAASRASCRDSAVPRGAVNIEQMQRYADWALRKQYIDVPVQGAGIVDLDLAKEAGA